jgi:hypothetical protein
VGVLAASAWAFFSFGLAQIDLILLVVGAVGLALGGLSLLTTLVGALLTWLAGRSTTQGPDLDVECGYPVATGFGLPRRWWLPLVAIRWTWREPSARVEVEARGRGVFERVVAARRGEVEAIVRRIEVGDVFGLTRVSFDLRERRRVRFIPSVGALERIDVIRGMSAGDDISHPDGPPEGDLYDIRHYTPGDPIRFVLWKVFAKSRELVVRAPERALSRSRQTVAFLVGHQSDEAAAGAARLAVERGVLGERWVLGADGVSEDADEVGAALGLLARSAQTDREAGGKGLTRFLGRAAASTRSRAVVFVPATPGPWIERTLAACRAHAGQVEFIVCCDGFAPRRRGGWWRRHALDAGDEAKLETGAGSSAEGLGSVVRALSGGGGRVVVVDRVAGRVFGGGHLKGFLEEAA